MLNRKSLELRDKYFREIDSLLPKVLRNLQRIHGCAMKNIRKLRSERPGRGGKVKW